MIKLFGRKKTKEIWTPCPLTEIADYLPNGERGFYQIRRARLGDELSPEALAREIFYGPAYVPLEGMTLELLQIHLGNYREKEISPRGLEQLKRILEIYRGTGVKLILRFVYDWEGKGMEADPASLALVRTHIRQIGEILSGFSDLIYIFQGVLVGSWGEMHSSRYLGENSLTILMEELRRALPPEIFLAVRTPAYWRALSGRNTPLAREEAYQEDAPGAWVSLFNDGMLGNEQDCGTYSGAWRASGNTGEKRSRQEELDFQHELNLYVPNGGETVNDNPLNDFARAKETLAYMRVSYLNARHDGSVLDKWKQSVYHGTGVYDGMSGYDYIERHLGYRYVVRSARAFRLPVKKGGKGKTVLEWTVENVGFASRYTPCRARLICRNRESGQERVLELDADLREWYPGSSVTVVSELPLPPGSWEIFLGAFGVRNRDRIFFANAGASETGELRLGTLTEDGEG